MSTLKNFKQRFNIYMITLIYSNFVTVMWLVCALFFIRTVSYSSDIIN